ncbi:hypothetical protein JL721_12048 [Aureococcus anophagefferens]|nr:hypothetical protein JL721_12048 [Aureococcus anophagefferens]
MMKRLRRPGATGGDPFCLPEPLFVRRAASDGLDLAHRAYGDDLAILLADMITELPALRRLNVRGNRLSDAGIAAILGAVCGGGSHLRALDLSQNVLDGAAIDSLARFLETEACALEELHLDGADVDDGEIRDLVRAVAKNATLKTLALSGNFLGGAAEKLANCAPEDRGAYAVAKALRTNATLTKLDLSWNQLGAQSGSLIGGALMKNRSLAWFSLAFNCIGDAGAMALGGRSTRTARSSIWTCRPTGSEPGRPGHRRGAPGQPAADAPRHERQPRRGSGRAGAARVAQLRCAAPHRARRLRALGDGPGRNPATPQGHYDLDLDDPFQWMVAKQLIWLSVTRAGAKFRSLVEIDASSGGKPTKRGVTLVSRTPEADKPGAIGWEPGKKVEGPKAPISREVSAKIRNRIRASLVGESVESIIDKFDDDNSGTLDASELTELMRRVFRVAPAEVSDADIRKLLDALDEDASGTISTAEFAEFVDKGDAAFFVKSPKKAKPAGFHAIVRQQSVKLQVDDGKMTKAAALLQARLRGFFGRVDAVQKFEAGVTDARTSSVARALIVADYAGVRESAAGGTAANLLKVTRALRTRIASKASVEHARFKMKSVMAATTSRQVRLSIARLEPLDSETGRPYKLPTGPKARLQCHLTAATMPPSELSVQNATGIAAMERLILSPQVGDRIALVRLAAVDLRIFAMQLQHFLDRLMQSARPLDGGEIVDFFVCLLPRVVDVHSVAGLVQRNLSEAQTAHLWAKLGPAMPVFAGAVAARHDFDLTQPLHRAALCMLVQMDQIFVAQQRGHFGDDGGGLTFSVSASAGGDLSQLYRARQNSDYRGFRNATLNGDPISSAEIEALTATFGDAGADAPTLKGKAQLKCDYAGFLRAPMDAAPDRDLAGSFKAPEAADADGFKAWLDKRRVPAKTWPRGELDAALRQLKAREAHWACDLVPALTGRKKKRPHVKRTIHVVRARISHFLEEKVLIWRPPFKGSGFASRAEERGFGLHVAGELDAGVEFAAGAPRPVCKSTSHDDFAAGFEKGRASLPLGLETRARDDEEAAPPNPKFEIRTAEDPLLNRGPTGRGVASALAALRKGELPLVESFVTSDIRVDEEGSVLLSPANTAARSVLRALKQRLRGSAAVAALTESDLRCVLRTRRKTAFAYTKPRTLPHAETQCYVYYFEVYVHGLPDALPPMNLERGQCVWLPADEAEDVPTEPERAIADCFLELVSPANEADAPNLAPAAEQARSLAPATKAKDARLRRGSAAPSMADLMDAKVTPTKAKMKQKRNDEAQDAENASAGSRNGADRERRKNVFGDKKKRRGDLKLGGAGAAARPIAKGHGDDRQRRGAVVADAVEILPNHHYLMDLFVHLLSRVVDPENFYWNCMARLPKHLHYRFLERVGWLNVLDAMNPHTHFELDFKHLDHWKVGHVLTQLAATEDGVNFINAKFQRDAETPPIPGWDLPTTWDVKRYKGNLQKGVPHAGLLSVDYTCLPENEQLDERDDLAKRFTLAGVPRPETDPVEAAATAPRKPGARGKDRDVALGMTDARPARHVPGLLPRQSSTSRGHLVPS